MKVLHVMPSVDIKRGGPSVAIRHITNALAAKGGDVTVATTTLGLGEETTFPTGEFKRIEDVRYIYFPVQWPAAWMYSPSLSKWLFQNVHKYDLVHIHAAFPYPVWSACRASFRAGIPYIVRPAGTLDPYGMAQKSWKKLPYYKLMIKPNLVRASAIHVTSAHEGESFVKMGFGAKVHNIPHGIDLPDVPKKNDKTSGNPLQLLLLSRLHPIKAIPVLLQALALLAADGADMHLTIAGNGTREYTALLEQEVKKLDLQQLVSFAGYVSGDAKYALYRKADVFVLPSYHENFGIAVAEALSYGLPVIVSDQVALSAEIAEAKAGLVVPTENPVELAAAISALTDGTARGKCGQNALNLVKIHFSVDEQIRRLTELYNSLVSD